MIFEEQFPVPRYTSASKIGNSVISLLWQLWCRCNPDHNKFSSSSNTTVVAIFPKPCLRRRSLCSNLGGIGPEKLYRATLIKLKLAYFACEQHPKICLNFFWIQNLQNYETILDRAILEWLIQKSKTGREVIAIVLLIGITLQFVGI